jgi:hypothetical protein
VRNVALLLVMVCGCKEKPAAAPVSTERKTDDVSPGFEGSPRAVSTEVAALCEALHQMPAARRAACCRTEMGVEQSGECARVLSLALEAGTVQLHDSVACVKALIASHQGCGWVGPNEDTLPDACVGVVAGVLPLAAKCRSTLECAAGNRCLGAGPSAAGVCAPLGGDGAPCEQSADVLASYTRQPLPRECAGFCAQHRCQPSLTDGGARAQGLRCVDGVCFSPKPEGAACERDVECIGACVSRGDAGRHCGAGC